MNKGLRTYLSNLIYNNCYYYLEILFHNVQVISMILKQHICYMVVLSKICHLIYTIKRNIKFHLL